MSGSVEDVRCARRRVERSIAQMQHSAPFRYLTGLRRQLMLSISLPDHITRLQKDTMNADCPACLLIMLGSSVQV